MRLEPTVADAVAAPLGGAGLPSGIFLTEHKNLTARQVSLIDRLSARERAKVQSLGVRKSFAKGAMVFCQGAHHDGIFLIEDGSVRVFYTAASGREITLAYWTPGNFVGGPDVTGGSAHMWSGAAARPTRVLMLTGDAVRRLILEVPEFALGIVEGLSFKGKCYSALAQILGTRSVTERLAHLLLQLADIYGRPAGGGIVIDSSFTHADLAHIVGATRQWVTMMLKRLQADGVLDYVRGQLCVRDRDALVALEVKD